MALNKIQKEKIIKDLKDKIERQKIMIFVDFTGLKVKEFSTLRKKLKANDNGLKVAKKTLMEIAFKEAKLDLELEKILGKIALVFGYKDIIIPAKIIWEFSQKNPNLKISGGFLEGQFREVEEIITLAQIPSREELLGKLVGSLQSPISNFVNTLMGNIKGLINVLAQAKTENV